MSVLWIVTAIVTVWLWTYAHWYTVLIAVFWCCRLWKLSNNEKIKHIIIVCCVSFSCMMFPKVSRIDVSKTTRVVTIYARDVKVDGDKISAITQVDNESVTLRITAKTIEEKQFFEMLSDTLYLQVIGEFKTFDSATGPYEFDYQRYQWQHKRQFYQLIVEDYRIIGKNVDMVAGLRQRVKHTLPDTLFQWVDVFVFGANWDNDMQINLQSLGVLWLFSLSGVHIHWLLRLIKKILCRLGITKETIHIVNVCLSFLLYCLAPHKIGVQKVFWQQITKKYILVIMLGYIIYQPYIIYHIGFQLSFGLLFIAKFQHAKIVSMAWVAVILSAHYYQFFVLSYLLVPIVLWVLKKCILPMIWLSFTCGVVLWWIPFLNSLDNFLQLITRYLQVPFNSQYFSLVTGRHHDIVYGLIMAIILYICYYWKTRQVIQKVLIMIFLALMVIPKPVTRVIMLDVGQGDSFVVQKGYDVVLIDTGGRMGFMKEAWRKGDLKSQFETKVLPVLRGLGIVRLNAVLLSHADIDHSGDLEQVKRHYIVNDVVYGQGAAIEGTIAIDKPRILQFGQVRLEILYPLKAGKGENEDSLIVYTKVGKLSFLFTGDALIENERALMLLYPNLTVDVLKVGHHGSKTSTDLTFVKQLKPKYSLISVGKDNRYGHPHEMVLKHLENTIIYRTDWHGVVIAEERIGNMIWKTYKK